MTTVAMMSDATNTEVNIRLSFLRCYDPGAADGIIGANTRKAIRGYQQRLGWPADGYPTQNLLEKLRAGR